MNAALAAPMPLFSFRELRNNAKGCVSRNGEARFFQRFDFSKREFEVIDQPFHVLLS